MIRKMLGAAVVMGVLAGCGAAPPDARQAEVAALADRQQIEDLLFEYYGSLGKGSHDFAKYFTADAMLDVNGEVANDHAGIEKIYRDTAARSGDRKGTFRMLLTNLQVTVDGDKATASMIWTGINSETVTAPPQLIEQGTEQDELVKVDGRWLFSKRVVISDGGMPEALLPSYQKRLQH